MGDLAKDINSTFPSEYIKALINIKYTSNWIEARANEQLKPFQITVQQYNVLRILRGAKESVTVQTVKDRMVHKSPNTTRLMDKLCTKNLIERTRCDSDRRLVYVKISRTGLDLLERVNLDDTPAIVGKLSKEEAQFLNELLDKIR